MVKQRLVVNFSVPKVQGTRKNADVHAHATSAHADTGRHWGAFASRRGDLPLPKGSAAYTAAEAKVQTVFQGTTLRGLLLEAYGYSLIATIALWCAIAAFCLAGVMAVLVGLGFAHVGRTDENEELLATHTPEGKLVTA